MSALFRHLPLAATVLVASCGESSDKAVEAMNKTPTAQSEEEAADIAIEVFGPKEIRRNTSFPLLVSIVNSGPETSAVVVREVRFKDARKTMIIDHRSLHDGEGRSNVGARGNLHASPRRA